jgi:hypothetical protein
MIPRIFALDINGRSTLCFNATDAAEAIGICSLDEFRADLMALSSGGVAICDAAAVFAVRAASDEEIVVFDRATANEPADGAPVFAFLVGVDGQKVVVPE